MRKYHQNIKTYGFVIMSNHIHGIIVIAVGADSISALIQYPPHGFHIRPRPIHGFRNTGRNGRRAEMDSAPYGCKTDVG